MSANPRLRAASWALARTAAGEMAHYKFSPEPNTLQPLLLPLLEQGYDFKRQIMPALGRAAQATHALICDAQARFPVRNPAGYFATRFRERMADQVADKAAALDRHRIIPLDARMPREEYLDLRRRIAASLSGSEDAPTAGLE